jgi:hypothetical protein
MEEVVSSDGSDAGDKSFIHLVSVDGPLPFKNVKIETPFPILTQINKVIDYSRPSIEVNVDIFSNVEKDDKDDKNDKDKLINSILEPRRPVKYYPPKRLPNPFEEAMLLQA